MAPPRFIRGIPISWFILTYKPSVPGAAVAGALYLIIGAVLLRLALKHRTAWSLCLPIGALCSGIGYILRLVMSETEAAATSLAMYIVALCLIVCSPALLLAFNYILFGRLSELCLGTRHAFFKPRVYSTIFIISDVSTYVFQAAGGALQSISATEGPESKMRELGLTLFKTGVILQSAAYYAFFLLMIWTHLRIKREGLTNGKETWRKTYYILYATSVFIIIRSIFRILEATKSRNSPLHRNEAFFYGLDAVPLIIANAIYIPWWPTKYMDRDSIANVDDVAIKKLEASSQNSAP